MRSNLGLKMILIILCGFSGSSHGQMFQKTSHELVQLYSGRIEWVDLDDDDDLDIIYSGFPEGANEFYTKVYENVDGSFVSRDTGLPNLRNGAFALADYDRDGDLDVLLSGLSESGNISDLYENKGELSFSLKSSFPGLINAVPSWFDIDNDKDMDFLLTGVDDHDEWIRRIFVYENTESGFEAITDTNLPPCSQCSMDWADINGDKKTDLIICGFREEGPGETDLYLNNGDNTFSKDESAAFKDVYNGDVRWGDYDNDDDMDLLLSGGIEGDMVAAVYRNTGGEFEERTDILLHPTGANWFNGTQWVDYDNDGLLDILLTGRGTSVLVIEYVFKLFKNKGNGSFEEVSESSFVGISDSSVDFGDYDNDGDVDFCYNGISSSGPSTGIYENKLDPPPPVTAISESLAGDISIYPNPVRSVLNITSKTPMESSQLVIRDLLGREILRQGIQELETSVDFKEMTNGSYLVNVIGRNGNSIGYKRIIKI